MTQYRRLARSFMLACAAACAFAVAWAGSSSVARAKSSKATPQAAQAAKDSKQSRDEQKRAAARQAYDAGLKQFANGRYQPAVEQLTAALKTGGLSPPETAKALYTRGIAYKKQKQPGLAISDLTSALWLKNGLTGKDRDMATAERAEAYQMAGIQDTGKGPERVIGAATTPPTSGADANAAGLSAAAVAQAAAANKKAAGNSSPTGPVTRQDASSASAQEAARARAAYAPVDSLAGSTITAGGTPAPAAAAPQSSSFGSGVTHFFSNLFGGGASPASTAPSAAAGVTTASTAPTSPEISSWSSATVVNHGASSAREVDRHKAHAKTHATKGKYKIHIAALRSRAEAEALAQKIAAQHGAELDNRVPTVDEKVIGSMGTFYRVRIGSYASQDEPRGICNKLRTSGLDCLVVTN
jgi:hypothetical protein